MKTLGNCNGLSGLHLALVLIGPRGRGGMRGSRGNSIQGGGGGRREGRGKGEGGGGGQPYHSSSLIGKGARGKLKSNPLFRHKKGLEGV